MDILGFVYYIFIPTMIFKYFYLDIFSLGFSEFFLQDEKKIVIYVLYVTQLELQTYIQLNLNVIIKPMFIILF